MAKRKTAGADRTKAWTARDVVELAVEHDLVELEVEQAGLRVHVVRDRPAAPLAAHPASPPSSHDQPGVVSADTVPAGLVTVEAPMVGTFYRASAPDAAPFIREGEIAKEGQILCIIEAMKLMNEIEAKAAGRIVKILVDNGQPVEYGQALFLLDPRA
jgi:acetyl-CoA carboxylase biotin carboxyl carrier protein